MRRCESSVQCAGASVYRNADPDNNGRVLSERDYEKLSAMIDNPPEPNEAAKKAAAEFVAGYPAVTPELVDELLRMVANGIDDPPLVAYADGSVSFSYSAGWYEVARFNGDPPEEAMERAQTYVKLFNNVRAILLDWKRLKAELEERRSVATCGFCGHQERTNGDPGAAMTAIADHMMTCEQHPTKRALDAVDELSSQLAAANKRIEELETANKLGTEFLEVASSRLAAYEKRDAEAEKGFELWFYARAFWNIPHAAKDAWLAATAAVEQRIAFEWQKYAFQSDTDLCGAFIDFSNVFLKRLRAALDRKGTT